LELVAIAKAALAEACAEAPKSTAQVEIRVEDHGSSRCHCSAAHVDAAFEAVKQHLPLPLV
jgi:hypothetical protein